MSDELQARIIHVVYDVPDSNGNSFEDPVILREGTQVQGNCTVGAHTRINGATIYPRTDIGRFCSIARFAAVGAGGHPMQCLTTSLALPPVEAVPRLTRTMLGHDVWIGANAVVLSGVTVGTGACIAGGAVVTGDVEPYSVVAGVPARPIKRRFADDVCSALLASAWWTFDFDRLATLPADDVQACLDIMQDWRTVRSV